MSQSPPDAAASETKLRYIQGWKALNRLLHEDRSFSGHEKNCAFLNLQNGQFASVSSVTGLDFPDDGRAIATCDWDFDGRLDLWLTARSAPRVRFVRNQSPAKANFVALRLEADGKTTNRQAIGARVEVFLDPSGDLGEQKLIKTLHAGDGFLSQSGNWMHFGLGDAERIEKVVVHWPTGKSATGKSTTGQRPVEQTQAVEGVLINQFNVISQGVATARLWTPPRTRVALEPRVQQVAQSTQQARIVLPARLAVPRLRERSDGDEPGSVLSLNGPLLVNVWSNTCPNCIAELTEWTRDQDLFKAAGLDVIALNADSYDDSEADSDAVANREQGKKLLQSLNFPFRSAFADSRSIRSLDYSQRAVMDRWQTMPVPCSFLLDEAGQVVVIYKGPVTAAQVAKDCELITADPEAIRIAAAPFPGNWYNRIVAFDPTRVSSQMIDHADIGAATDYLDRVVEASRSVDQSMAPTKLADILYVRSVLLESQGDKHAALTALQEAVQLNPDDFRIRSDLGRLFDESGQFSKSEQQYMAALEMKPDDVKLQQSLAINLLQQEKNVESRKLLQRLANQQPVDPVVYFHLATAARKMGDYADAIQNYRTAFELQPTNVLAANNLSWILATHSDESLRNSKESLQLAKQICQLTKFKHPQFLDSLAVAYAANDEFDNAIKAIEQALKIVVKQNASTPFEQELRDRLDLFQQGKPFREAE